MEYLVVITVLNHSGSFGQNFVKFKKKKCYSPALVGSYREKLCLRSWVPPEDVGTGYSFSQYGPPGLRITYLSEIIHRLSVFPTYESKITFQILICSCWSHSFAPIHQNLKFRTWVQVITVLKMWDISLHSRSLYSIRRRCLTFQCELPLGGRFIHVKLSFRRFCSQFSKVHR